MSTQKVQPKKSTQIVHWRIVPSHHLPFIVQNVLKATVYMLNVCRFNGIERQQKKHSIWQTSIHNSVFMILYGVSFCIGVSFHLDALYLQTNCGL